MGYTRHNTIIVTANDYVFDAHWKKQHAAPDIDAFRAKLPTEWQQLVIGPISSITNGYLTFVFAPDGSKEGWGTSEDGDRYRQEFLDLFSFAHSDGSSPFDVLVVDARFGGDEPGAEYEDELIVSSNMAASAKLLGREA